MAIMKRSVKGRFRAVDDANNEGSVGFHSIRLTFVIRLLMEPIIFKPISQVTNSSYSYIASYVSALEF